MENSLFQINAYRTGRTWLFDDESRGIQGEPFVMGASELLTKLVKRKFGKNKRNATFTFSETYIPEYDAVLSLTEKVHPVYKKGKKYYQDLEVAPTSGYYVDEDGDKCWLCPAQLKFFGRVAETIFIKL